VWRISETPMSENDPYWKLKPPPPTPADEICHCEKAYPIIICYASSENPIRCANCNQELPPERFQPTAALVDEIASWRQFYSCFYNLWLDSGEFEDWARSQLSDPNSPANERGYKLCEQLSSIRPCYYWWFQDTSEEGFEAVRTCPKCNSELVEKFNGSACDRCLIILANGSARGSVS
jgi:predicted  nucleic acid-binding Zn ribbon protein